MTLAKEVVFLFLKKGMQANSHLNFHLREFLVGIGCTTCHSSTAGGKKNESLERFAPCHGGLNCAFAVFEHKVMGICVDLV